jgi:hypothetical protein
MLSRVTLKVIGKQTLHEAHHYVHLTYLALVFVESHGLYGIAAGVLGVIVLVDGVVERVQKHRGQKDESNPS